MTKKEKLAALILAAQAAADWLTGAEPGTHQHTLGCELTATLYDLEQPTPRQHGRRRREAEARAENRLEQRIADRIDGHDRDDLGESRDA